MAKNRWSLDFSKKNAKISNPQTSSSTPASPTGDKPVSQLPSPSSSPNATFRKAEVNPIYETPLKDSDHTTRSRTKSNFSQMSTDSTSARTGNSVLIVNTTADFLSLTKEKLHMPSPVTPKKLNSLHKAVFTNDVDKVKKLVAQKDRDVNKLDSYHGCTALHLVAEFNKLDVVRYLLDPQGNGPANNWVTPANKRADPNIPNLEGRSAFLMAVKSGNIEMAILLLNYGANINFTDPNGCHALHYAILAEDRPMFDMLVEKGININSVDKSGNTLLHHAVRLDRAGMAASLIEKGHAINILNNEKSTPLHLAMGTFSEPMIRLLLSYGARVDAEDSKTKLPMDYVKKEMSGDILFQMVENALGNGTKAISREDTIFKPVAKPLPVPPQTSRELASSPESREVETSQELVNPLASSVQTIILANSSQDNTKTSYFVPLKKSDSQENIKRPLSSLLEKSDESGLNVSSIRAATSEMDQSPLHLSIASAEDISEFDFPDEDDHVNQAESEIAPSKSEALPETEATKEESETVDSLSSSPEDIVSKKEPTEPVVKRQSFLSGEKLVSFIPEKEDSESSNLVSFSENEATQDNQDYEDSEEEESDDADDEETEESPSESEEETFEVAKKAPETHVKQHAAPPNNPSAVLDSESEEEISEIAIKAPESQAQQQIAPSAVLDSESEEEASEIANINAPETSVKQHTAPKNDPSSILYSESEEVSEIPIKALQPQVEQLLATANEPSFVMDEDIQKKFNASFNEQVDTWPPDEFWVRSTENKLYEPKSKQDVQQTRMEAVVEKQVEANKRLAALEDIRQLIASNRGSLLEVKLQQIEKIFASVILQATQKEKEAKDLDAFLSTDFFGFDQHDIRLNDRSQLLDRVKEKIVQTQQQFDFVNNRLDKTETLNKELTEKCALLEKSLNAVESFERSPQSEEPVLNTAKEKILKLEGRVEELERDLESASIQNVTLGRDLEQKTNEMADTRIKLNALEEKLKSASVAPKSIPIAKTVEEDWKSKYEKLQSSSDQIETRLKKRLDSLNVDFEQVSTELEEKKKELDTINKILEAQDDTFKNEKLTSKRVQKMIQKLKSNTVESQPNVPPVSTTYSDTLHKQMADKSVELETWKQKHECVQIERDRLNDEVKSLNATVSQYKDLIESTSKKPERLVRAKAGDKDREVWLESELESRNQDLRSEKLKVIDLTCKLQEESLKIKNLSTKCAILLREIKFRRALVNETIDTYENLEDVANIKIGTDDDYHGVLEKECIILKQQLDVACLTIKDFEKSSKDMKAQLDQVTAELTASQEKTRVHSKTMEQMLKDSKYDTASRSAALQEKEDKIKELNAEVAQKTEEAHNNLIASQKYKDQADKLQRQYNNAVEKQNLQQRDLDSKNTLIKSLQTQVKDLKLSILEINTANILNKTSNLQHQDAVKYYENEVKQFTIQLEEEKRQRMDAEIEHQRVLDSLSVLEENLSVLRQLHQTEMEDLKYAESQKLELSKKLEAADMLLAETRKLHEDTCSKLKESQGECESLKTSLNDRIKSFELLERKKIDLESDLNQAREEISSWQDRYQKLDIVFAESSKKTQETMQNTEKELLKKNEELKSLVDSNMSFTEAMKQSLAENADVLSQLSRLKELVNDKLGPAKLKIDEDPGRSQKQKIFSSLEELPRIFEKYEDVWINKLEKTQLELEKRRQEIESNQLDISHLNQKVSSLESAQKKQGSFISQAEDEVKLLESQLAEQEKTCKRLASEKKQILAAKEELEQDLVQLKESFSQTESKSKRDTAGFNSKISTMQESIVHLQQEMGRKQIEIDSLKKVHQENMNEHQLKASLEAEEKLVEAKNLAEQVQRNFESAQKKMAAFKTEISNLNAELNQAKENLNVEKQKSSKLSGTIDQFKTQFGSCLKEIVDISSFKVAKLNTDHVTRAQGYLNQTISQQSSSSTKPEELVENLKKYASEVLALLNSYLQAMEEEMKQEAQSITTKLQSFNFNNSVMDLELIESVQNVYSNRKQFNIELKNALFHFRTVLTEHIGHLMEDSRANIVHWSKKMEKQTQKLSSLEKEYSSMTDENNQLKNMLRKLKTESEGENNEVGSMHSLRKKKDPLSVSVDLLNEKISELEDRYKESEELVRVKEKRLAEEESQRKDLQRKLKDAEADFTGRLNASVRDYETKLMTTLADMRELQDKLGVAEKNLNFSKLESMKMETNFSIEKQGLESKIDLLKEQCSQLNRLIETAEKKHQEIVQRLTCSQNDFSALQAKEGEYVQEIEHLKLKLKSTQALMEARSRKDEEQSAQSERILASKLDSDKIIRSFEDELRQRQEQINRLRLEMDEITRARTDTEKRRLESENQLSKMLMEKQQIENDLGRLTMEKSKWSIERTELMAKLENLTRALGHNIEGNTSFLDQVYADISNIAHGVTSFHPVSKPDTSILTLLRELAANVAAQKESTERKLREIEVNLVEMKEDLYLKRQNDIKSTVPDENASSFLRQELRTAQSKISQLENEKKELESVKQKLSNKVELLKNKLKMSTDKKIQKIAEVLESQARQREVNHRYFEMNRKELVEMYENQIRDLSLELRQAKKASNDSVTMQPASTPRLAQQSANLLGSLDTIGAGVDKIISIASAKKRNLFNARNVY